MLVSRLVFYELIVMLGIYVLSSKGCSKGEVFLAVVVVYTDVVLRPELGRNLALSMGYMDRDLLPVILCVLG